MGWLASIFIALLSGALGLFLIGFISSACVKWYRISGFEGKSGYFVVFNALFGGIVGLAIGVATSQLITEIPGAGFFAALGLSAAIILAAGGLIALVAWWRADIPPKIHGEELTLEIELRLPAGATTPPAEIAGTSSFTLGSVSNHVQRNSRQGELDLAASRLESGRWIIPASVHLYTSRGLRAIGAELGGKSVGGFIVPLPAWPGPKSLQWSEWGPRGRSMSEPWPDTNASYRFRVARIVPPPPGPAYEDIQAEEAAKEQAVFEAVPADAPIAEWFPYTRYGAPDDRRAPAIERITARPDHLAELAALMLAEDARTAAEAMYLVEYLPMHGPELIESVTVAGRHIAALMRWVNVAAVDDDPEFLRAADVSILFSAWMAAVRTLREKAGADFVPELRTILELSRVRTDSYVMQADVRRVASYYVSQWAGIAPLPGDPPPK